MDQRDLERAALRLVTKKLGHKLQSSKKDEFERLKKALEDAKAERARLLLQDSRQDFKITTVGKVVQDRVRLERQEQAKLEYIKRARGDNQEEPSADRAALQKARAHEEQALRRARVLKLNERVTSFRLAGVSSFSVGGRPHDLGLRFDATWGGHYFDEKYYVILTGSRLEIHRHSLPYFIPMDDLAQTFLPMDPSQFCRRISRYVCAFAGRRVLAEQLAKDFVGKATVSNSASLDIITLTGRLRAKGDIPVHSVQLKFEDVLDLIPNKADVCFLRPDGEMILQKVVLDRIPGDIESARFFNYGIWIKSVLDKRFTGIAAVDSENAIPEDEDDDEDVSGDDDASASD